MSSNSIWSSKVAALTHELMSRDGPAAPKVKPPAQNPAAVLDTHMDHHKPGRIGRWFEGMPSSYDVFTAKALSSNGTTATVTVDGSKDGSIDLTDGKGNHAHVKKDGSTTIDGNGQHGTFKIRPGTVLQVGDAKVRFGFDYPDDSIDHPNLKPDDARITAIDIATNNDDGHAIDLMSAGPLTTSPLKGDLTTFGEAGSQAKYPYDNPLAPTVDEPDGTSTFTSSPQQVVNADHEAMIQDPQLRLGPGGIYALDQAGLNGGKLAPDAMSLDPNGKYNNLFTSLLDPTKIDVSQPLA